MAGFSSAQLARGHVREVLLHARQSTAVGLALCIIALILFCTPQARAQNASPQAPRLDSTLTTKNLENLAQAKDLYQAALNTLDDLSKETCLSVDAVMEINAIDQAIGLLSTYANGHLDLQVSQMVQDLQSKEKPLENLAPCKAAGNGPGPAAPPIPGATNGTTPAPTPTPSPTPSPGDCFTADDESLLKSLQESLALVTAALATLDEQIIILQQSIGSDMEYLNDMRNYMDPNELQAAEAKLQQMQSDLPTAQFQQRLRQKEKEDIEKHIKELEGKKKCSETGMVPGFPPYPGGGNGGSTVRPAGTMLISQDSDIVCTYDRGGPEYVDYTPLNPGQFVDYTPTPPRGGEPPGGSTPPDGTPNPGGSTPPAGTPPTPTTPGTGTPGSPPPAASNPPAAPKTDTPTPTTTDQPPVATTPDGGDDTVVTYDKDTIEQDGHTETGNPVDGQLVMLTVPKPALARGDDTGSASDPKKCLTVKGSCAVMVHRDERTAYGLPDTGDRPAQFRVDLAKMNHTAGVADVTGKAIDTNKLASVLPSGGTVKPTIFTIGTHTYLRLEIALPANHTEDVLPAYSRLLGTNVDVDYCDEDKPGADAAAAAAAAAATPEIALPLQTLRLRRN